MRYLVCLALLLTACAPKTPTFQGDRFDRFEQAIGYYQEKMGLEEKLYIGPSKRFPEYCAWTLRLEPPKGFEFDPGRHITIGINDHPKCLHWKPELLALHEACHVRMKHNEPQFDSMPTEEKELEVRKCTYWYEEGVR